MSNPSSSSSSFWWLGGVSSCIAACATHPLDLLKVRLQTNNTNNSNNYGLIKTIANIARNDGILSFYNGLSASLLRQASYSTVRFAIYEELKSLHKNKNQIPVSQTIIYSLISGCIGGIAGNPADLINVRMQNDKKLAVNCRRNYRNVFHGLYTIIRDTGIISLWNGVGPNIIRAMLMTTGQLASYDIVKSALLRSSYFSDNSGTHFSASLIAGGIATAATQPVDVIKTRVMNESSAVKPSSILVAKDLLFREGIFGFYRGFLPAFIRLGPHTIITFMAFEKIKQFVQNR